MQDAPRNPSFRPRMNVIQMIAFDSHRPFKNIVKCGGERFGEAVDRI